MLNGKTKTKKNYIDFKSLLPGEYIHIYIRL